MKAGDKVVVVSIPDNHYPYYAVGDRGVIEIENNSSVRVGWWVLFDKSPTVAKNPWGDTPSIWFAKESQLEIVK